MACFIRERLSQAIFVVLALTGDVSSAIRLSGDPAMMLTEPGSVIQQGIQKTPNIDRSFAAQYLGFLEYIIVGDWARSFGGTPVSLSIGKRLPLGQTSK